MVEIGNEMHLEAGPKLLLDWVIRWLSVANLLSGYVKITIEHQHL